MCSIAGGFIDTRVKDNKKELSGLLQLFLNTVLAKGGDYTSIIFFDKEIRKGIFNSSLGSVSTYVDGISDRKSEMEAFNNFITNAIRETEYVELPFLIFSRLTPEMEESIPDIFQPYKTIANKYVAAHGTIPLGTEGENYFDTIIDTEIFRYDMGIDKSIEKVQALNGKISLIEYDPGNNMFTSIHNGLGIWLLKTEYINLVTNVNFIDTLYMTPMLYHVTSCGREFNLSSSMFSTYGSTDNKVRIGQQVKPDVVISLCSGGMDTLFSTYDWVHHSIAHNDLDVELLYFDWGTVAAKDEMASVDKFKVYLENQFQGETINVFVEAHSINVKSTFKNILDIAGLDKVRIADPDARGQGQNEAEKAISYVPFRNTYLLMMAATYAEQKYPNKKVDIVIGANLTEGMVYLDNSTNYIEKMTRLVKVAGQKTSQFNVVAPYRNYTKTKMLDIFMRDHGLTKAVELLELAFSCYFPNDGKPCNECGSCVLRDKALERSKLKLKN